MHSFRLRNDGTGVEVLKGGQTVLFIEINELSSTVKALSSFEAYLNWTWEQEKQNNKNASDVRANEHLQEVIKNELDSSAEQFGENSVRELMTAEEQDNAFNSILNSCKEQANINGMEAKIATQSPPLKKKKKVSFSTDIDKNTVISQVPNVKLIRSILLDINAKHFHANFPDTVQRLCVGCVNPLEFSHVLCKSDRKVRIEATFDTIVLLINQDDVKQELISHLQNDGYSKFDEKKLFIPLSNLLKNNDWKKKFMRCIDQII